MGNSKEQQQQDELSPRLASWERPAARTSLLIGHSAVDALKSHDVLLACRMPQRKLANSATGTVWQGRGRCQQEGNRAQGNSISRHGQDNIINANVNTRSAKRKSEREKERD